MQPQPNPYQGAIQSEVANVVSRLRLLEERHTNLQRKMHLIEEHLLTNTKEIKSELKITQSDMVELKRNVHEFADIIDRLTRSLEDFASRDDMKVMEKYINLLDPTNFISRAQLESEVKRQVHFALLQKEKNTKGF